MDEDTGRILSKILGKRELDKIPPDIVKKLEKYFDQRFEEFLTTKARYETSQHNIDQIRTDYEQLCTKTQDCESKMDAAQQNVQELRRQLDSNRTEISTLTETIKQLEADIGTYRTERNLAFDERDELARINEKQDIRLERFAATLKTTEAQLEAAIKAKCEALTMCQEVEAKEHKLDFKEKILNNNMDMLKQQVAHLTAQLEQSQNELKTLKYENAINQQQLEHQLAQKTEEINSLLSTNENYKETHQSLVNQVEELNIKLKEQTDESGKLMEHYQKEIQTVSKLADLYKCNNEDGDAHIRELNATVVELKKTLTEITDKYGEMETKLRGIEMVHENALSEKNKVIEQLQGELKNANELLKTNAEEGVQNTLERISPSAAAASKLMKSGMSMTEIYTKYIQVTQQLQVKEREHSQQEILMKNVVAELEERIPEFNKQTEEYHRIRAENEELHFALQQLRDDSTQLQVDLNEATSKFHHFERENKKLRTSQSDLSRQVCHMIHENEKLRGGFVADADQSISSDMSANEIISKKYVTFAGIQELQDNNQKLLLVVRDLTNKLEEMDEAQSGLDQAGYESKLADYARRIQDMETSREQQQQLLNSCLRQKDRFRKLYFEIMKDTRRDGSFNGEQMDEDNIQLASTSSISSNGGGGGAVDGDINVAQTGTTGQSTLLEDKNRKITDLEEKIKDYVKQIKILREEHEEYRKDRNANDKIFNEQFESMRNETRDLISTNCKLMANVSLNAEQLKLQQKNVAVYKKQIKTLEERNMNYDKTITKHEQTLGYLREEAFAAQRKCSALESKFEELSRQYRIAQDNISSLSIERESLYRERQSQNLLQTNLEMIKTSIERSETEGRIRMEQRFDEVQRECAALRRRLQEEQDRHRELDNEMKKKTDSAVKKMTDEQAQAESLRKQVEQLRADVQAKSDQINDLSQKLQESLTPCKTDNPIAKANKKVRELTVQLEQRVDECEHLKKELKLANENVENLTKMASSWETENKELSENWEEFKAKMTADLATAQLNETNLKSRVEELQTEIRLQITGAQINTTDTTSQLHKVQNELKESLQKISENNIELRTLRAECQTLKTTLNSVEQKYQSEMVYHTADIQALGQCKEELHKIQSEMERLREERELAVEKLKAQQDEWEVANKTTYDEKKEFEQRIADLDAQNALLHDQIQALSNSIAQISQSQPNESLNESGNTSAADVSLLNRSSGTDDDSKLPSIDQLLSITKYLRKEKDLALRKLDIVKAENIRLSSETAFLSKKLKDANQQSIANAADSSTAVNVNISSEKHADILRKIETLNAVTDSNRLLREERDSLNNRIKELTESMSKIEEELFPLQEKHNNLEKKSEEQAIENQSLRMAAERWRKRSMDLVERSNKNPEDFKRLQNERENLAKMLTSEKENLRIVTEELTAIRNEKTRVDAEVANLTKLCQTHIDDKKKIQDELNTLKQQNIRLNTEVMELKNSVLTKEDELKKINDDLAQKEILVSDAKNKEFQIRKIAKRYKDSFFELKAKEEERESLLASKSLEEQVAAGAGTSTSEPSAAALARAEAEKQQATKIEELTAQLAARQDEIDQLRRELEASKKTDEKNLLAEAKARINALTEANKQMSKDYQVSVSQLQTCEAGRTENELLIAGLKSQYEARITRIEKELADQDAAHKETIARLSRENDSLMLRVSQLHRQLQLPQGTKPSTSSVAIDKSPADAARTANVKPMAGPSGQSATVNPRRGGDTPLASIRPMSVQNSRTAAVLPTSQTSSVTAVQAAGSVTALVPPQQQVHTTGNSSSAEAMSSSPTSSHTDYMPATSSAVVVAAVPPMGAATATAPESSQEAESTPVINTNQESSSSAQAVLQQQVVALVSPRIEVTPQSVQPPAQQSPHQLSAEQNQAGSSTSSTSTTTSSSSTAMSTHHQASSSNTVTTTHAGGHKRPRDAEGDSSTSVEDSTTSVTSDQHKTSPKNKRTRLGEQTFQGVSESGLDVEYQVPTSSQRDQEDDNVIVVDSEEDDEDDGMVCEGMAETFEDDADNGESYEMEEAYDQEQDDEGEGPDISEDQAQHDTNEVEVDDSSEAPNQSTSSAAVFDVGTSAEQTQQNQETQQIQTISSGSEARSSTSWHADVRQSSQNLIIQQAFEETGDDSIVPSTPTLYVPRRVDGFSEAVSSPHPQVPQHAARFTFNESGAVRTATAGTVPEGMMDDTRIDLSQLDQSGSSAAGGIIVPTTPAQVPAVDHTSSGSSVVIEAGESSTSVSTNNPVDTIQEEAVAGPSSGVSGADDDSTVPEIVETDAPADDANVSGASTSDNLDESKEITGDDNNDEEIGTDGVSSEGEKAPNEGLQVEEGREAEATPAPNTRSSQRNQRQRGGRRGTSVERPTPIIWQEGRGQFQQAGQQQQPMHQSPQHQQNQGRGSFQRQRGGRRMKRGPQLKRN